MATRYLFNFSHEDGCSHVEIIEKQLVVDQDATFVNDEATIGNTHSITGMGSWGYGLASIPAAILLTERKIFRYHPSQGTQGDIGSNDRQHMTTVTQIRVTKMTYSQTSINPRTELLPILK